MRQTPLSRLIEVTTGLDLRRHVLDEREAGRDWRTIADDLSARAGHKVSHESVRQWFADEDTPVTTPDGIPLRAEAGHAAVRLLAAVALAFVIAAGLPIHAGFTLLVAVFVGWVFVGLFGAELSTWGTRHLAQRGRRDRTADR